MFLKQDAGQAPNLGPAIADNRARNDNEDGTCEGDFLQND